MKRVNRKSIDKIKKDMENECSKKYSDIDFTKKIECIKR